MKKHTRAERIQRKAQVERLKRARLRQEKPPPKARKPRVQIYAPWALKPRPKGAKKSTGKAELPLSDRVVSNAELRRLGHWRTPSDEEERMGGLPAGLRS